MFSELNHLTDNISIAYITVAYVYYIDHLTVRIFLSESNTLIIGYNALYRSHDRPIYRYRLIVVCDADALNHFDGGSRSVVGENATAGIFVTFPQPYLTTVGGFVDQVSTCTRAVSSPLCN